MTAPAIVCLAFLAGFWAERALAQPQFQEEKIRVGKKTLSVQVAQSEERRNHGLMFRKKLNEDRGMLFVFESERRLSFWMKNTFIPLSIGFFDAAGALIEILDMEPVSSEMVQSPPTYVSREPSLYALEVPRGWFARHKVRIGSKLLRHMK